MQKHKIYLAQKVPEVVEVYLKEHCEIEKWEGSGPIHREELMHHLKDKEGVLLTGGYVDEVFLEHAPQLKVVSTISVGYNNFKIEAMKARGVIGTNTPKVLDDTVADLILGLMLATSRRIPELDQYVKTGSWKKGDNECLFGRDVHHRTLGIIGMGRIGSAVAKRARFGFDMDVIYYNRNRNLGAEETLGVVYKEMETVLRESDFVVLMTPLTEETKGMIGAKEFAMMKKEAIFINASRGQTVDEVALIQALEKGLIAGAGLDVFDEEPTPVGNPLLKMPQVVALPHIGSATERTRTQMAMQAAESLVRVLNGEHPETIVPELRIF